MAAYTGAPRSGRLGGAGQPREGAQYARGTASIRDQLKRRGLIAGSVALLTGALAKISEQTVQAADGNPLVLGRANAETTPTMLTRTTQQGVVTHEAALRVVSTGEVPGTAITGDGGDRGTGVIGTANLNGGVGVIGRAGGVGALGVHNIGITASGLAGVIAQGDPAVEATGGTAVVARGSNAGFGVMASGGGGGIVARGTPSGPFPPTGPNGPGLQADGNPGVDARGDVNAIVATGKLSGVIAVGNNFGVVGTATVGVHGTTQDGIGTRGVATANGRGVVGLGARGAALEARNTITATRALLATPALAGEFFGDVFIHGELFFVGPISAAVNLSDGSRRRAYGIASPEPWIEDIGAGDVVGGIAQVQLDPEFAAAVKGTDYHVFLTPRGDSNGLYVSNQTASGFVVREQRGGLSTLAFSYRVLAKHQNGVARRFAKVPAPQKEPSTDVVPPDVEVPIAPPLRPLPTFPSPVELPDSLKALPNGN
jgi:hypothetical protein